MTDLVSAFGSRIILKKSIPMEFIPERNVYLERNKQGTPILLTHDHTSLFIPGKSAHIVAFRYLREYGDIFGLKRVQLKKIILSHAVEDMQSFTTSVWFYQTEHNLLVWNSGMSVQMRSKSFRILCASSTLRSGIQIVIPSKNEITKAESFTEDEFLKLLRPLSNKFSENFDADFKFLKIKERNLLIYHFENTGSTAECTDLPETGNFVCAKIVFEINRLFKPSKLWMAIVEVRKLSILYINEISEGPVKMDFRNISGDENGIARSLP